MKSEGAAITRILTLLGAALSVVVAGASQGTSHRPDVRFLPTPDNVVDAMLELAHVTASDIVFDLGSGDGRIPIAAAKKYGVTDRVTFVHGDLFQSDISQASVVTLFLLPSLNMQLIPKFKRELRPGARIVSHHFGMGDAWLPDAEQNISGLMIYLWAIR